MVQAVSTHYLLKDIWLVTSLLNGLFFTLIIIIFQIQTLSKRYLSVQYTPPYILTGPLLSLLDMCLCIFVQSPAYPVKRIMEHNNFYTHIFYKYLHFAWSTCLTSERCLVLHGVDMEKEFSKRIVGRWGELERQSHNFGVPFALLLLCRRQTFGLIWGLGLKSHNSQLNGHCDSGKGAKLVVKRTVWLRLIVFLYQWSNYVPFAQPLMWSVAQIPMSSLLWKLSRTKIEVFDETNWIEKLLFEKYSLSPFEIFDIIPFKTAC